MFWHKKWLWTKDQLHVALKESINFYSPWSHQKTGGTILHILVQVMLWIFEYLFPIDIKWLNSYTNGDYTIFGKEMPAISPLLTPCIL